MLVMLKRRIINFIWIEKNTKLIKQPKIIFQLPKTIEKPNIVDIKSVNIEYPKTLNKVSKPMRQAKKVSHLCGAGKNFDSLYILKKKKWKGYVSTCSIEVSLDFWSSHKLWY